MKLNKRIKLRRALPSRKGGFVRISAAYRPIGYYYNRPHIANPYHQMEIGRVEGFRFIVSK